MKASGGDQDSTADRRDVVFTVIVTDSNESSVPSAVAVFPPGLPGPTLSRS